MYVFIYIYVVMLYKYKYKYRYTCIYICVENLFGGISCLLFHMNH